MPAAHKKIQDVDPYCYYCREPLPKEIAKDNDLVCPNCGGAHTWESYGERNTRIADVKIRNSMTRDDADRLIKVLEEAGYVTGERGDIPSEGALQALIRVLRNHWEPRDE